jgi:hypothetical protein
LSACRTQSLTVASCCARAGQSEVCTESKECYLCLPPNSCPCSPHSRELVVCVAAAFAEGGQADVLSSTASPVEACLGMSLDSRGVVAGRAVVWAVMMTAAAAVAVAVAVAAEMVRPCVNCCVWVSHCRQCRRAAAALQCQACRLYCEAGARTAHHHCCSFPHLAAAYNPEQIPCYRKTHLH